MTQNQSLLMFSFKNTSNVNWNFVRYQSRGVIIEMKHPGDVIAWPFNHFVAMETPSWPIDTDPSSMLSSLQIISKFVSVFTYNNSLMYTDESSFDSDDVKKVKQLASNYSMNTLDYSNFYHILAVVQVDNEEKLYLVGLRSKITYDLMPLENIEIEAKKAGLYFVTLK